jgi:hypothetical protein
LSDDSVNVSTKIWVTVIYFSDKTDYYVNQQGNQDVKANYISGEDISHHYTNVSETAKEMWSSTQGDYVICQT